MANRAGTAHFCRNCGKASPNDRCYVVCEPCFQEPVNEAAEALAACADAPDHPDRRKEISYDGFILKVSDVPWREDDGYAPRSTTDNLSEMTGKDMNGSPPMASAGVLMRSWVYLHWDLIWHRA